MKEEDKKYKLGEESKIIDGHILHRIIATCDIPEKGISPGVLGGWIEKRENLSQEGTCWIGKDAAVYGLSEISGNALVCGDSLVIDSLISEGALITYSKVIRSQIQGSTCLSRSKASSSYMDTYKVFENKEIIDKRITGNSDTYLNVGAITTDQEVQNVLIKIEFMSDSQRAELYRILMEKDLI